MKKDGLKSIGKKMRISKGNKRKIMKLKKKEKINGERKEN